MPSQAAAPARTCARAVCDRLVKPRGSALAFTDSHPSSLPKHKGLEPCPGAAAAVTQRRRYEGEKCHARCIGGRVSMSGHGASVFPTFPMPGAKPSFRSPGGPWSGDDEPCAPSTFPRCPHVLGGGGLNL